LLLEVNKLSKNDHLLPLLDDFNRRRKKNPLPASDFLRSELIYGTPACAGVTEKETGVQRFAEKSGMIGCRNQGRLHRRGNEHVDTCDGEEFRSW
jgi:hypothetical protein